MLMRQLLRQLPVSGFNGLHNALVLRVGFDPPVRLGQGLAPHPQHILVKILQLMLQQLAVAGLVHNIMETVIQLCQLLHMSLLGVEFRQINILLHFFHLFLCDMLRSPPGTQPLQQGTYHVDVFHILFRDASDIGSLIGNNSNQTFQLQLPEGLPDRGTADPHLLTDGHLL